MDFAMQHEKSTMSNKEPKPVQVAIYVAPHCSNCQYAYLIADQIQTDYPQVELRIVDLSAADEEIPESVFATPTYLLNGRVWSLGNPSHQQVRDTLGADGITAGN